MIGSLAQIHARNPSRRALIRAAGAVATLLCTAWGSATAEVIEFQGLRFPVDKLTTQDNGDVLVEIDGRSWLAPQERVFASVAEEYLAHPELGRRMPWANYVDYLVRVADIGPEAQSSKALEAVLQNSTLKMLRLSFLPSSSALARARTDLLTR